MSTPYNWEPEPEPDDLGPETLWDEYWANMDASRDEEVPDPEDDAPVPYRPALQPPTTEQLTARLALATIPAPRTLHDARQLDGFRLCSSSDTEFERRAAQADRDADRDAGEAL